MTHVVTFIRYLRTSVTPFVVRARGGRRCRKQLSDPTQLRRLFEMRRQQFCERARPVIISRMWRVLQQKAPSFFYCIRAVDEMTTGSRSNSSYDVVFSGGQQLSWGEGLSSLHKGSRVRWLDVVRERSYFSTRGECCGFTRADSWAIFEDSSPLQRSRAGRAATFFFNEVVRV